MYVQLVLEVNAQHCFHDRPPHWDVSKKTVFGIQTAWTLADATSSWRVPPADPQIDCPLSSTWYSELAFYPQKPQLPV